MTKVNFGGLKQKLLASIVAISAVQAFVVSAFMLALSDRWSGGDHGGE